MSEVMKMDRSCFSKWHKMCTH